MTIADRASRILSVLEREYPDAKPLLDYRNPFELLIAVILSAQTTDAQVNSVTPELFRRFPGPGELARAPVEELEGIIHGVGFFRTKAKNIRGAAAMLVERFEGRVPDRIDDLLSLPGVGRKSANVVVSHVYALPGIIVDTHFSRVTRRLGLSVANDPAVLEREIGAMLPESSWTAFSMCVNYHGRRCCTARKPACFRCAVRKLCLYEPKTAAAPAEER